MGGGGSTVIPDVGGLSGQGGGRKMPAVQTGIGELIIAYLTYDPMVDTN